MFIQEIDLFRNLSQHTMNQIAEVAEEVHYAQRDSIFSQGNPADFLYILREGSVRLTFGEEAHTTYMVNRVGEAFGWSSLVGRETYMGSAEATSASSLTRIHRTRLDEIFERDPASGITFFKGLAAILGQRLMYVSSALPVY